MKEGAAFQARVRFAGHVAALLPAEKRDFLYNFDQPTAVSDILEGANLQGMFASILVNGKRAAEDYIITGNAEIILISPAGGG